MQINETNGQTGNLRESGDIMDNQVWFYFQFCCFYLMKLKKDENTWH